MISALRVNLVVGDVTYPDFLVTALDDHRYRLEEHAEMSHEANYQDVIYAEMEAGQLVFKQLVQKADLNHFDFLLSKKICRSAEFEDLLLEITANNGYWTQSFGGVLLVSLPTDSKLNPTAKIREIHTKYHQTK